MDQIQNDLIVKSNDLINSSYSLSLIEMKLVLKLSSVLTKDDDEFTKYKFNVWDLLKDFHLWKNHIEIEKAVYSLATKAFKIKKDTWRLIIWFLSSAEYFKGDWLIELCFDAKLKPYLLWLQTYFTAYNFSNVVNLKSKYSVRIYELLKSYEWIWSRVITVDELKTFLWFEIKWKKNMNKTYPYNMFKRRVILKAQEDILKQCNDLSFDFEEIKSWRTITAIKFIINKKKKVPKVEPNTKQPDNKEISSVDIIDKNKEEKKNKKETETEVKVESVNTDILKKFWFSQDRKRSIIEKYGLEDVTKKINFVDWKDNVVNREWFLLKALSEDFQSVSELIKRKTESQRKNEDKVFKKKMDDEEKVLKEKQLINTGIKENSDDFDELFNNEVLKLDDWTKSIDQLKILAIVNVRILIRNKYFK